MGGGAGARAGRRLGRPGALDADADRGRRQRRSPAPTADATCTSASASTAWARSSTASPALPAGRTARPSSSSRDYMKGAIRLAALMRLPSIFVFTHDSIGLGEDGPTHQPIEQLAHLRALPNINVVRPAGANETALAWQFAIERARHRPRWRSRARACRPGTRPACPTTRSSAAPTCCASPTRTRPARPDPYGHGLGGTHLQPRRRPARGRRHRHPRRVHALHRPLRAPGPHATATTSSARRARARSSVEAAATLGWDRWVGDAGDAMGMTTFGASGPARRSTSTSASCPRTSPSGRESWYDKTRSAS